MMEPVSQAAVPAEPAGGTSICPGAQADVDGSAGD